MTARYRHKLFEIITKISSIRNILFALGVTAIIWFAVFRNTDTKTLDMVSHVYLRHGISYDFNHAVARFSSPYEAKLRIFGEDSAVEERRQWKVLLVESIENRHRPQYVNPHGRVMPGMGSTRGSFHRRAFFKIKRGKLHLIWDTDTSIYEWRDTDVTRHKMPPSGIFDVTFSRSGMIVDER